LADVYVFYRSRWHYLLEEDELEDMGGGGGEEEQEAGGERREERNDNGQIGPWLVEAEPV